MKTATRYYLNIVFFLLPLVMLNGYYNITETKSIFFVGTSLLFVSVSVIGILYQFRMGKQKNHQFHLVFVDIVMFMFGLINLVSAIFSKYQEDVWIGQRSRLQGAVIILLYVILYFIISNQLDDDNTYIKALIVAFEIVVVIGVLNSFGVDLLGIYKELDDTSKKYYISTIGNINFYSSYICLCLPVCMTGFCTTKEKDSRHFYAVALSILGMAIGFNGSDSFVIGVVVSFIAMFFFFANDMEKIQRYSKGMVLVFVTAKIFSMIYQRFGAGYYFVSFFTRLLLSWPILLLIVVFSLFVCFVGVKDKRYMNWTKKGVIIFISVVVAVFVFCFVYANVKSLGKFDIFFKFTDKWGTYRGIIYRRCIGLFKDFTIKEKLIGIGPEAVLNILGSLDGEVLDQAHCEYLQILMTTGMIGLGIYLSFIVGVFVIVVKYLRENDKAVAFGVAIIAYFSQALVNIAQPFSTPLVYLYIAIILGLYKIEIKDKYQRDIKTRKGV